jgi:hypothetical protein
MRPWCLLSDGLWSVIHSRRFHDHRRMTPAHFPEHMANDLEPPRWLSVAGRAPASRHHLQWPSAEPLKAKLALLFPDVTAAWVCAGPRRAIRAAEGGPVGRGGSMALRHQRARHRPPVTGKPPIWRAEACTASREPAANHSARRRRQWASAYTVSAGHAAGPISARLGLPPPGSPQRGCCFHSSPQDACGVSVSTPAGTVGAAGPFAVPIAGG